MFKRGKNIPVGMGEDGVSIVTSQSLATKDFTCEINPDTFLCNILGKIRMNVILSPGHLTKETGKLTCLQTSLKLTSLLLIGKSLQTIQMNTRYHLDK